MVLKIRPHALWLVLAASCRQSAPEQAALFVRDSSGIQIVENASPAWSEGQGWQLSESVVIGEADGDENYLLNRVTGATRMPDGRIIIANSRAAELRVYDAAGRHLQRVGRKGWGPGEFQRPDHLLRLAGDTIAVWDAAGPVNFFDDKLRYIRREPINLRSLLDSVGWDKATESLTPLPDGSLVVQLTLRVSSYPRPPEGKVYRPPLGYYRVSRDLSRIDSLGWYGGLTQMYLNLGGRRVYATALIPAHASVTGGGVPLQIYAGNGDPYEIHAYNAEGGLTRIIRRTNALVPLPTDIEKQIRGTSMNDRYAQQRNRVRAALPPQTHYPAYRQLSSDADANLWVTRAGTGTDIFDRNGRWLGTRDVRGRLLEIGRDHLLVLRVDSLGVEQVVLYTLRRS